MGPSHRLKPAVARGDLSEEPQRVDPPPIGVARARPDGTCLEANDAFCETLGYTRDELARLSLAELGLVDAPSLPEGLAQPVGVLRDERHFERHLVRRDGSELHALVKVVMVSGLAGEVDHHILLLFDLGRLERADSQLRENMNRYRLLAEHATDLISRHGPDGSFLYASPAARDILGYEPEELIDRNVFAGNIHPDDVAAVRAAHAEVIGTRKPTTVQWRARRKDGSYVWVESTSKTIYAADGSLQEIIAITRNIEARRRTEAALHERELIYRSLVEHTPLGMHFYELTPDDQLVLVSHNPAADDILGIDHRQLLGQTLEEAFPPLVATDVPSAYRAAARIGASWSTEQIEYRDNRVAGAYEVRAFQTTPMRMVAVFADITDRIQAQRALAESERRYRFLAENQTDLVWTIDLAGVATYMSPSVEQLLGYKPEEVVGTPLRHLAHPDSQEVGERKLEQLLADAAAGPSAPIYQEMKLVRRDGLPVWTEASVRLLFEDGRPYGLLGVTRDITERKRAQEERAKLQAQLEQVGKMEAIGRLAGGVAHDFNNLLTAIIGNISLALLDPDVDAPVSAYMLEAQRAAESAAELTRQLLAFSRKQVLELKVIDVNELVARLHRMLSRLIGEDIELVLKLAPDLYLVRVDPAQIEQALVNLCVNARDAMPEGGTLRIQTANVLHRPPGKGDGEEMPYVAIRVSDTGAGMSEEAQRHVFEPFYTTKSAGRGTGLGLATTYGAIRQNDGTIEVDSVPAVGTTFTIYLPKAQGERSSTGVSQPLAEKLPTGDETVLLVEDDGLVRRLAHRYLLRLGYRVLEAMNAEQALDVAHGYTGAIHLLFTDVVMPGANGRELASRLQEDRPDIKVLFTSGYTADAIGRRGVLEEDIELIRKPYRLENLAQKIRAVLDKPRR
jgi:PAS domain S-box-containing protein